MRTAVVIGASRGIGLEFVVQLQASGYRVFGTSRAELSLAPQLDQILKDENHLKVDLTDIETIKSLKDQLKAKGITKIDVLINNAGIFLRDKITSVELADNMTNQLQVNAIAPIIVIQTLIDFFQGGTKIMVISSYLASLGLTAGSSLLGYRMSKAAINMGVKALSNEFTPKKIYIVSSDPGIFNLKIRRS